MKFYCRECQTEYVTGINLADCPVCGAGKNGRPPAFFRVRVPETVAEWEERRGREYPGAAPAYARAEGGPWTLIKRCESAGFAEVFAACPEGMK